jgi:plastocyanin
MVDLGEGRSAGAEEGEFVRRAAEFGRRWAIGGAVAVVLLTVTACAPSEITLSTGGGGAPPSTAEAAPASPEAPAPTTAAAASRSKARVTRAGNDLVCTKATKVAIVQKASAGGYAFSSPTLTIQRGGFLAVTNSSDQVHGLVSTPNAGIVKSVLARNERQVIQFPRAGTFTVASALASRAVLRVTVSGESGCGSPKPTLTIVNGFAFQPAKVTVAATANFAVVNKSSVVQAVICTPGANPDNARLARGETQLLALDQPGRYVCSSRQHPEAKAAVTVTR